MAFDLNNLTFKPDETDRPGETEEEKKRRLEQESLTKTGPIAPTDVTQSAPSQVNLGNSAQLMNGQPNPAMPAPAAPVAPAPAAMPAGSGAMPAMPAVPAVPQAAAAVQPKAPVSTVQTPTDQYIAQNESGNNPNIGYHFPGTKQTAYGTYGITAPAYKDIQQADSYFANKPIAALSPEDQTRAEHVLGTVYSKQLAAKGVDPTPQNLAMSQILGAGGTHQYLTDGTFSKAAMEANGGEGKLRAIVEGRRNHAQALASGAAAGLPPPNGVTAKIIQEVDHFTNNLKNNDNLYSIAKTSTNPGLTAASNYQIANNLTQQRDAAKAQSEVAQMAQDPTALANALKGKSGEEGSWTKMVLYGLIGAKSLMQDERNKLGLDATWQTKNVDGEDVLVQMKANGLPMSAFYLTGANAGKELTGASLGRAAGVVGKHVTTGAEVFEDKSGNKYYRQSDETGNIRYVEPGGKVYKGLTSDLTPMRQISAIETKRATTLLQANKDLLIKDYKAGLDAVASTQKMRAETGQPLLTPTELEDMGVKAPDITRLYKNVPTAPAPAAAGGIPAAAAPAGGIPTATETLPAPAGKPFATTAGPVKPQTVQEFKNQQEAEKVANQLKVAQGKEDITLAGAQKKASSTETGKKLADIQLALPKAETNADATINVVNKLLNSPGFNSIVGEPVVISNIKSLIPGSQARDWMNDYKQLKGKEFTQAFESLRGGGSISDKEGARATDAIAALNDPGISPAAFKKNAQEFVNIVKDGINNQRRQIGASPKYPDTPSEKARAWVEANPTDPRAAAIKQKLGIQ